jgi:hypothetical protein
VLITMDTAVEAKIITAAKAGAVMTF